LAMARLTTRWILTQYAVFRELLITSVPGATGETGKLFPLNINI